MKPSIGYVSDNMRYEKIKLSWQVNSFLNVTRSRSSASTEDRTGPPPMSAIASNRDSNLDARKVGQVLQ